MWYTRWHTLSLTSGRIDRYTRAAQSNRNDLTHSNLQPAADVPQTPKSAQATHPGSPTASNHAQPDHAHQFPTLPPPGVISGPLGPTQQARQNQSALAKDGPTSPTSAKEGEVFTRPRRSSSVTMNPSIISGPLPSGASANEAQPQGPGDGSDLGLTRTRSSVALDGEPRMFPGIVSKNARKSSMRSSAVEDGSYPGFRKGEDGITEAEERDTDDEE